MVPLTLEVQEKTEQELKQVLLGLDPKRQQSTSENWKENNFVTISLLVHCFALSITHIYVHRSHTKTHVKGHACLYYTGLFI